MSSAPFARPLALLAALDAEDTEIARAEGRRAALQAEVKAARLAVAAREARRDELEARRLALETSRRLGEKELKELDARVESAGLFEKVKNQKEYEAAQAALVALKARRSDLEERTLTAVMDLEATEAELASLLPVLPREAAAFAALKAERKAEHDQEGALAHAARARRGVVLGELEEVAPSVRRQYDQLLEKHGDHAISVVKDERCTFCHLSQPPHQLSQVKMGKALFSCVHCGRLLVIPATAPET